MREAPAWSKIKHISEFKKNDQAPTALVRPVPLSTAPAWKSQDSLEEMKEASPPLAPKVAWAGDGHRTEAEAKATMKNLQLWNKHCLKPRCETWGHTDDDMSENYKMVKTKGFEQFNLFRGVRRKGLEAIAKAAPAGISTRLSSSGSTPNVLKDEVGETMREALSKAGKNQGAAAIADLDVVLARDPGVIRARRARGQLHLEARAFEAAFEDYNQALLLDDKVDTDWVNRAKARMGMHDYAGAIDDLGEALKREDRRWEFYHRLAVCKVAIKDYKGAERDANRGMVWERDSPDLACIRAEAKFMQGEVEESLQDYSKAIKFDTKRPQSWFERAKVRGMLQDWEGSLKDVNKAIELAPKFVESWVALAKIHAMKKEWRAVFRDCTVVIKLSPEVSDAWALLGQAKMMLRDYEGAMPDLREAARLDPRSPLPCYLRGRAKFFKGMYLDAAEDLRSALRIFPGHDEARELLAKAEAHDSSLKNWKLPALGTSTPRRTGQDCHLVALVDENQPPMPPPKKSPSSPALLVSTRPGGA